MREAANKHQMREIFDELSKGNVARLLTRWRMTSRGLSLARLRGLELTEVRSRFAAGC
jgi:hypothetical protein